MWCAVGPSGLAIPSFEAEPSDGLEPSTPPYHVGRACQDTPSSASNGLKSAAPHHRTGGHGNPKVDQRLTALKDLAALRTKSGLEKTVRLDLFPAYDDDGVLLVALSTT